MFVNCYLSVWGAGNGESGGAIRLTTVTIDLPGHIVL